ncbi:unnamed protein product [Paramecium octaurelia]|uniref:Uncharacterized protein n=1 Tax=Paramecium octaurelia TaxID=43137 RepID=A0A8S1X6H3_PAROT|nr:unnamed protein product [Paramecium octaurelia]
MGFMTYLKSLIRENIKTEKKLEIDRFSFQKIRLVVDYMLKEVSLRLEDGLNKVMGFMLILKQFMKLNIKMVQKLVDGIFLIRIGSQKKLNKLEVGSMMERIQNKLENGLNQAMTFMIYLKLFIMANTRMVKRLADCTFYLEGTLIRNLNRCILLQKKRYSGGRLYDEGGSFRIGRWIESSDGSTTWSQVTVQFFSSLK